MVEARGYSIWMMPSGQVYDELSGLIMKLSGEYGTPKFEPHVTLLGAIEGFLEEEVSLKTSELANLIKPFKIELEGLDGFDEYFRCLFIRAKETPELMNANLEARKVFSRIDATYGPHLSLVYGELSKDMKGTIILNLKNEKEGKEPAYAFDVDKLHLFSTRGEPDKWYRAKEFPLVG